MTPLIHILWPYNMLIMRPILYQNKNQTVTLIDVPTSIAYAQGTDQQGLHIQLLSSKPQAEPYQITNEPTSKKRSNIQQNTVDTTLDEEYRIAIQEAIAEIKEHHKHDWCFPRWVIPSPSKADKKRKAIEPDESEHAIEPLSYSNSINLTQPDDIVPFLNVIRSIESQAPTVGTTSVQFTDWQASNIAKEEAVVDGEDATEQQWEGLHSNDSDYAQHLTIKTSYTVYAERSHQFLVPPQATFLLGDCDDSAAFRSAVRLTSDGDPHSRRFDLILLDPPWPNSSAKRKGAYRRSPSVREVGKLISGMDLDSHIAPNGLIGIWVTNKSAIRELVLGPGGLFESLNVGLIEEWIWIKTTVRGEPISDIDSMWRKPYEVLLLGRAPPSSMMVAQHTSQLIRRVIAGVPDLHSRKPCLKVLLEPLLPKHYRALEIFARNLVAGWWSWGDEVLKFNWKDTIREVPCAETGSNVTPG